MEGQDQFERVWGEVEETIVEVERADLNIVLRSHLIRQRELPQVLLQPQDLPVRGERNRCNPVGAIN